MDVLYLHPVGAFSGASRSLLELLRAQPRDAVRPRLLMARGKAAQLLAEEGFEVIEARGIAQFDCTRFGHYRGLRWLILARELWFAPFTLLALLRAKRRWPGIALIHVNEITALLPGLVAKALFGRPLVVHVRSVQVTSGAPLRRWLLARLLRRADAVVAIDDTVRASLPEGVAARVVRNSFDPGMPVAERPPRSGPLRVGMVGSLLGLKGVYDFLEAARLCATAGANVQFVLVGSNVRRLAGWRGKLLAALGFARDVEADVERFIVEHAMAACLRRQPFTPEVSRVYRELDVLCFPSLLDAVGRPVLEAAWFGVPSIVAAERSSPDTFLPGETGLLVPAGNPRALAQAILRFEADRAEVARMGAAALRLARANFDSGRNAREVLALYRALA